MLHVDDVGNRSGEPVVFIHGFMSSNAQWDLNRERLGERFRMLLVELPGHGHSIGPDQADVYGRDAVLGNLEQLRTDLGLERVWVVGHSLGGAVAARYALAHPDRVRGLVVTNSRAMFGLPRRSQEPPPPATLEERRAMPTHPIHAKRFPAELKEKMVAAADAMPAHAIAHLGSNAHGWSSKDDLADLAVPTLLVNGKWEKAFQKSLPLARGGIADLEIVDLDGGHSINVEQPQAFDEAVTSFIDRTRSANFSRQHHLSDHHQST